MTHDPKCLELAEYFLQGVAGLVKEDAHELAQAIQATIEEWMPGIEELAGERRAAS